MQRKFSDQDLQVIDSFFPKEKGIFIKIESYIGKDADNLNLVSTDRGEFESISFVQNEPEGYSGFGTTLLINNDAGDSIKIYAYAGKVAMLKGSLIVGWDVPDEVETSQYKVKVYTIIPSPEVKTLKGEVTATYVFDSVSFEEDSIKVLYKITTSSNDELELEIETEGDESTYNEIKDYITAYINNNLNNDMNVYLEDIHSSGIIFISGTLQNGSSIELTYTLES
ncbi:MAG: hypothetical protein QY312_03010 [Candidatus Dojkabacteria bacterium]|nr:MAG: hypothetical protein QY312_03010 [Candidatus Dojkabacteria bacterium]